MSSNIHRRHRRSERGQVTAIIALASVALLGATALAVDLSVDTHVKRNIQNATDAAALAGAHDLPATPAQSDRQTAAFDAMVTLYKDLGQSLPSATALKNAISSAAGCTSAGTTCHVVVSVGSYSLTVNTPPQISTQFTGKSYLETYVTETTNNAFGRVIGQSTTTEAGRSVAYHFAGNQPFGFALYANHLVSTGNDGELISGNVYAGRDVDPQSGGKAGFCTDSGGLIIFGSPQSGDSGYDGKNNPGQADVLPKSADVVNQIGSCGSGGTANTTSAGTVNETGTPGTCSNVVSGVQFSGSFNSTINACETSQLGSAPSEPQPTLPTGSSNCGAVKNAIGHIQPGIYECDNTNGTTLKVDAPMDPGVYEIIKGTNNTCNPKNCYDVDFNGVTENLQGVTFVTEGQVSIGFEKGATVTSTPSASCTRTGLGDCLYPIYAATGSSSSLYVVDNNTSFSASGSLYMPNGSVNVDSNALLQISEGQAIVDSWNVQSGFHNNPTITYSAAFSAPLPELLRLVE